MPSIDQIVAQIRTAVYGRDVRESIAEGIEICYEEGGEHAVKYSDIANNLTTTSSGKVLDARQGKVLNDNISQSVGALDTKFSNYVSVTRIGSTDDYTMVIKGV